MNLSSGSDWLVSAVKSLSMRRGFMARLMSFRYGSALELEEVAEDLKCSSTAALKLALMREPREGQVSFSSDIRAMSDATGITFERIVNLVRSAQSLEKFENQGQAGVLAAAARDKLKDLDE